MLFIYLALACASIAFTLTKTPLFEWAGDLLPYHLWQDLWSCPYCMSHWVAMALVAVVQPTPFTGTWLDFIISTFVIVTISAFFIQFILLTARVIVVLKRFE